MTSSALMPSGMTIELDPATRLVDNRTLLGGSPPRALRLSPTGVQVLREATTAPLATTRARRLARRLTDAGMAHPRPPEATALTVTVIIPVHNRVGDLANCLASLGNDYPIVVVDDGSDDGSAIEAVVTAHRARMIRREQCGGPGVARNTALAIVDTDVVAFVDSDCTPRSGWIEKLVSHLHDPLVAAVAPRIVSVDVTTSAERYSAVASSLDMGDQPALVAPGCRVSYVPTAALVVRRQALLDIATNGEFFDPSLRYGEDVDLVWRLHERGWRVRYDPAVTVTHREPTTWRELLVRRYHYGTSAAPLARRHPGDLAPLVIQPLVAVTLAAAVGVRPRIAVSGFAALVATAHRRTRAVGLTDLNPVTVSARGVATSSLGVSRYVTQFAAPAVVGVLVAARRPVHRCLALAALIAPGIYGWLTHRPPLNPLEFTVATAADHVAYGSGVWSGCLRGHTIAPIVPTISRRTSPANPRKS